MARRNVWAKGGWGILAATCLWAGQSGNIAPDAVTQATRGYNVYEGEIAYLTDGFYPDNNESSALFVWPNKGNLIFQFEEARAVEGVRLCVGSDAGAYGAIAYLGATLGEDGQTQTDGAVMVGDVYNQEFVADTWVELRFAETVEADYIEFITESGAEFYEIEILTPGPTQVFSPSWGQMKNAP